MPHVLHIEASPSGDSSHSTGVARELLNAYAKHNPESTIDTVDVWRTDLPPFDATMIAAKFAVLRTQEATSEQKDRWAQAVSISQAFNRADSYIFSLPMWNFGIPYRLKHYVDVVTLPGQNWSWSKTEGYKPLLRNKRAVLIYSSAGDYPLASALPGANADFQKPYMRQWLRFIGVDVVDEIVVAPTLTDPAHLARIKESSRQEALLAAAAL
jgi:FMN-dependent NADH-azoreductase